MKAAKIEALKLSGSESPGWEMVRCAQSPLHERCTARNQLQLYHCAATCPESSLEPAAARRKQCVSACVAHVRACVLVLCVFHVSVCVVCQ